MKALAELIPLLAFLFVLAKGNLKHFLLIAAIVALPFRVDTGYAIAHVGWIGGITITIPDILLICLILGSLGRARSQPEIKDGIPKMVGVFMLCSMLSMVNSASHPETAMQIILLVQLLFLYYWGMRMAINEPADFNAALRGISLSLLLQGLIACGQFGLQRDFLLFSTGQAAGETDVVGDEDSSVIRAFGTVGKPNGFAIVLVPLLLLNIALVPLKELPGRKLRLVSVFLGFLALIFTGSRGGWLSFFFALSIYVAITIAKLERGQRMRAVGGIFAVLVLGLAICYPIIKKRLTSDDKNAAGSRLPLMEVALNMIEAHPIIGVGANAYVDVMKQYLPGDYGNKYLYEVHNTYLLVFAEMGVIGFGVFLLLGRRLFRLALAAYRTTDDETLSAVGLGFLLIMTAICVHMMVEPYVTKMALSSLFLLTGVVAARRQISVDHQVEEAMELPVEIGA